MISYGKCLTELYKYKKKLPPVFKDFFTSGEVFGFDEILKLDINSWDFFIKSLNFIKTFHQKFENKNPEHVALYYMIEKAIGKHFKQWQSIPYLNCITTFANAVKNKTIRHYYVETMDLCKFLYSVEIKSIKDMMQFIQSMDNSVTFAFHLPDNHAFTLNFKIKNDKMKIMYETEGEFYTLNMPDDITLLDFINKNNAIKMCFNAISYTECFSENVRDGVPKDIKEKVPKSENSKTLSPFSGLSDFSGKEITAHFRHAHFRFCGSDFYKKKKGKWVFVKGSMVNSEAKTITEEK